MARTTRTVDAVVVGPPDGLRNVRVAQRGTAEVREAAARHAVRGRARFVIPDPAPSNNTTLYTVPSGKRLVIEYLSANVHTEVAGNVPHVAVGPQLNAAYARLPMTFAGRSSLGGSRYVGSEQVRLYADAGENIVASAGRSSGTSGELRVEVDFHGYLVAAS